MKLVSNKNWFDKECCFEKHELREISNQKHRDPLNANLREQYHDTLKAYKKLLNKQNNKKKMAEVNKTISSVVHIGTAIIIEETINIVNKLSLK